MDGKLKQVMADVFGVPPSRIDDGSSVESLAEWDSLRHMNLIFAIEDAYGIRFEDDEVACLTSVALIERALAAKR